VSCNVKLNWHYSHYVKLREMGASDFSIAHLLSTFQYTFKCEFLREYSNSYSISTSLAIALFSCKIRIGEDLILFINMLIKVLKSTL